MPKEKIIVSLFIIIVAITLKNLKSKIYIGYLKWILLVFGLALILTNTSEIINAFEKSARTIWPAISHALQKGAESFSELLYYISK